MKKLRVLYFIMEKIKWDEIITQCAEDYKALKSIEGSKLKTPTRDFIRAWMQVRYNIFKLSGYFYRKFNSLIIQENKRKIEEENLSESIVGHIKKSDVSDLDSTADSLIDLSDEQIKKMILKYGDCTDNEYNDWDWFFYPNMKWGRIPKDEAIFIDWTNIRKETKKYLLVSLSWSGGLENDEDSQPGVVFSTYSDDDDCWFHGSDMGTIDIDDMRKNYSEQYLKIIDLIKDKKVLDESITRRVKNISSKSIENEVDFLFRYKIGDCYPSEDNIEGVVCATPEEMQEDAYLIMSPTFINRLGKPAEDYGFRYQTNDFSEVIRKYCKKHGDGWQLLTYNWAKKMGMMENSHEIPWSEQEKVFKKFRDPIASTVEKLGHKFYGSNMLIIQKEPNWSMRGNYNMGGWEVCDYNYGNMLRLFKKVSVVSESFTKKVKDISSTDIKKTVDNTMDVEDIDMFFQKIINHFNTNKSEIENVAQQNECRFSFKDDSRTKTYNLRGVGQKSWEYKHFEFFIDYQKKQINKKTGDVKKLFVGQLGIQICNNLNYQDKPKFYIWVKQPWSWDSSRIDIPIDSFVFLNGDSDLNVPSHQRFMTERYTGSADYWKPNMTNAKLFIDMIEMIVYNFKMFNNIVNTVANTKVCETFRECFNMFKDKFYNESSESVY